MLGHSERLRIMAGDAARIRQGDTVMVRLVSTKPVGALGVTELEASAVRALTSSMLSEKRNVRPAAAATDRS